ncbi:lysozyme inhibitor LprI family protein [Jannaschia donghaensis]|uniref:Lysozyme inhibitor LprI N-terminal domain-containing protein n=1 Tax=Jannaschia donghaensis TaxID=420998 RepID=A0A0M6YMG8_9RHOB|nr:lysozyme inhibitor LprI family protein [Jannaschia donghaensis]CTQ50845.1 hypothetical protein JDO7802_02876 [Jannaschia donghaensis]
MRPWILALLIASPFAATAQTGPSFDCARAQTPTEISVCRHDDLAQLDQRMADLYVDEFTFLEPRQPGEARALRAEQLLWQRWRNTCADERNCLARRYKERIVDLDPFALFDDDRITAADGPSALRLRDGRLERVNADGTVDIFSPEGRLIGIRFPSGETQTITVSAIEVSPDGPIAPPPLPPAVDDPWLMDLELDLLGVVHGILPPEDHPGYSALHDGLPTPTRVERHISSIGILSR